MPAVQDIWSSINQFAQARLPLVGSRRGGSSEASRSSITRLSSPVASGWSDQPDGVYAHAGPEPLLDEVLGDPVVQLIMRADRVRPADLQRLLDAHSAVLLHPPTP